MNVQTNEPLRAAQKEIRGFFANACEHRGIPREAMDKLEVVRAEGYEHGFDIHYRDGIPPENTRIGAFLREMTELFIKNGQTHRPTPHLTRPENSADRLFFLGFSDDAIKDGHGEIGALGKFISAIADDMHLSEKRKEKTFSARLGKLAGRIHNAVPREKTDLEQSR